METHPSWFLTHLQWTEMGPSWPNCSFVLWTWPMKSINPSPDFGTPCSGQSVNWNCLTVRDCPSFRKKATCPTTEQEARGIQPVHRTLQQAGFFPKKRKKKLETCLTRKSVTFISYLLLTLSTFHIYLNCKLIYSHNAQLKTRILKKSHLILILGNESEPQRLSSKPKRNIYIPFQNFQNPITS